MRLKSLKLSGFKSFANPTTLSFKHGITAIVGPNGCGKSNVIDAMRWVLGESSAKQLRGGAMSDVIFAGTEDKAAKSLASVEMTFEHTQDEQAGIRHELNLYHELSVRRQVNRDGKSDYFINGTRCRRRDVVDVFLGTGLGPRSYSVIQQGMIGRIVDSSPMQLREFIEEAAGVSRYQVRREQTQKKISKTQENLERLTDIESELTTQYKKLQKQAKSAQSYQLTQEQLQHIQVGIAQLQWQQAQKRAGQIEQTVNDLKQLLSTQQDEHTLLKTQVSALNKRLAEEQWLKDDAREQVLEQQLAKQKAEHALSDVQSRIERLELQQQERLATLDANKQKLEEQQTQAGALTDTRETLLPQLETAKAKQSQTDEAHRSLETDWEASRQQVAELTEKKSALSQKIALNEQALTQHRRALEKWQQQQQTWQAQMHASGLSIDSTNGVEIKRVNYDEMTVNGQEDEKSIDSIDSIDSQLGDIETKLERLSRQLDNTGDYIEENEPKLNEFTQQIRQQQAKLTHFEKEHASLSAEYDTLHGIVHAKNVIDDNSQNTKGNSSALASKAEFKANTKAKESQSLSAERLPSLQDVIVLSKTGEQYAAVLDKFLAFWLTAKVGDKTNNDASNMVSTLIQASDATDKPTVDSVLVTDTQLDAVKRLSQDSPLLPLSNLISEPTLPILQRCYLYVGQIDDYVELEQAAVEKLGLEQAGRYTLQQCLNELPAGTILLTSTGWIISDAFVLHISKFDKQHSENNPQFLRVRLQQQQRLETLNQLLGDKEQAIDELKRALKQSEMAFEQLNLEQSEYIAQQNTLKHEQQTLSQQRVALNVEKVRQDNERVRLQQMRQQLDKDYEQLTTAIGQYEVEQQRLQAQLNDLSPRLQRTIDKQQQLDSQRHQQRQQEQAHSQQVNQLQLQLNQTELAIQHNQSQQRTLMADIQRLSTQQDELTKTHEALTQQIPQLQQAEKEASSQAYESQLALEERQSLINTLQHDINTQQTALDAVQQQLNTTEHRIAEQNANLAVANERINEAHNRLKASTVQLQDKGADALSDSLISELIGDEIEKDEDTENDNAAESDAKIEARIQKLQSDEQKLVKKINNMGAVNLAAAEALAEVAARLEPLKQQIEDISASLTTLNNAIATIDTKTKSLFLDTLNAVNESLNTLFAKVFGGGQAKLTLMQDDQLPKAMQWHSGLELMAQPKGKKNSRLAVLSGGEKTLTALSLVFAIFKQQPAPFCVLDEVDAPLDDANVMRFTNLITELANDVQFIFISHNKLSMQIADELKGITMPQAGISTQVSVSLAQAEHYIDDVSA